jgi:gluconolactonase
MRTPILILLLISIFLIGLARAFAQTTGDVPVPGNPGAIVNLATDEGVRLVKGVWRYSDARIVEVDHRMVGPDLKPSGAPSRTNDITPHAGGADFDDSKWDVIGAASLDARRSTGKLCFNWYRIKITIPERIADFDPAGSSVVLETVVDDYAEIWVDGKLPLVLGQTGGQLIKGFNAPNRVVITGNAKPGQQIQLAIFGANGPLSNPPGNFIWIRSATLDFYKPLPAGEEVATEITRADASLDAVVPPGAKIRRLAGGFQFIEGPVWHPDGYLLFSDPNANVIYRWNPDGQVTVFRTKSGYSGLDISRYHQPGSNGLTIDREGRLTIDEHGNRRVTRLEKNGQITVLADRYDGKRLNSPNDLVYRSDGSLYFTDPPFGLPKVYDDPGKELPFEGVFCLKDGKLSVVSKDFKGPNGLAFSPDEKYLYVCNWEEKKKIVKKYEVREDGSLSDGKIFYDMTGAGGEDALDGMKVDREGNVYVSGPGGLWILSPEGKHLGTIMGPEHPHNMAWGGDDARTLYLCCRTGLYSIRLGIPGTGIVLRGGALGSK